MAKKIAIILVFVLIALTITGIVLGMFVIKSQKGLGNEVELSQDGITKKNLSVSIEGLYPTKSVVYRAEFNSKSVKDYDIKLSFRQEEPTMLAQYLDLIIKWNESTIAEGNMQDFLDGETVFFDAELSEDGLAVLAFTYTMSSAVGNEAQKLTADFLIDIEAAPEGER